MAECIRKLKLVLRKQNCSTSKSTQSCWESIDNLISDNLCIYLFISYYQCFLKSLNFTKMLYQWYIWWWLIQHAFYAKTKSLLQFLKPTWARAEFQKLKVLRCPPKLNIIRIWPLRMNRLIKCSSVVAIEILIGTTPPVPQVMLKIFFRSGENGQKFVLQSLNFNFLVLCTRVINFLSNCPFRKFFLSMLVSFRMWTF